MNGKKLSLMIACVLGAVFMFTATVCLAAEKSGAVPGKVRIIANPKSDKVKAAEKKSPEVKSVQSEVEKKIDKKLQERKNKIVKEAIDALVQTQKALEALDKGKKEEALECLERIVGKLQLAVVRNPELSYFPIDRQIIVHDLFSDVKTVKDIVKAARKEFDAGHIQAARTLLKDIASEIDIQVAMLPMAQFPKAIMSVVPLIDKGKTEEAKAALRQALSMIVIDETVIPLPPLRAGFLLKKAEKLAEKKKRSDKENKQLSTLLDEVSHQIELARVLGYATRNSNDYKTLQDELKKIRRKTANGKSGKGFFDTIESKLAEIWP